MHTTLGSTIALAATLLLAAAPSANAEVRELDLAQEPKLAFLDRQAQKLFPPKPGCGRVVYEESDVPAGTGGGMFGCEKTGTGRILIPWDWREWDQYRVCTFVYHETGHMSGRDHDEDPRSIMYSGGPNRVASNQTRFAPCDRLAVAARRLVDLDITFTDTIIARRLAHHWHHPRKANAIRRFSRRIHRLQTRRRQLVHVIGPGWPQTTFDRSEIRRSERDLRWLNNPKDDA